MSSAQTRQIESESLEQSLALAARIGSKLRGGETIELISDLGGGKTTFVRGLAAGFGSADHVSSPSFTLSNQYRSGDNTLYHFDFYRLDEPGILQAELAEILADDNNVVAIEWADVVTKILPDDRLSITIRATGETSRQFTFKYADHLEYLVPSE